jgi:hypothetical protein
MHSHINKYRTFKEYVLFWSNIYLCLILRETIYHLSFCYYVASVVKLSLSFRAYLNVCHFAGWQIEENRHVYQKTWISVMYVTCQVDHYFVQGVFLIAPILRSTTAPTRYKTTDKVLFRICQFLILDAFAKLQKSAYYICHDGPSISPHASARVPLEEFPSNLILGTSTKICSESPSLVKIGHVTWGLKYCYFYRLHKIAISSVFEWNNIRW